MELQIAPLGSLIEATYRGPTNIIERYRAKYEIAKAARVAGVSRIVIDMTHAAVQVYGVADALRLVVKVESLTSFGHVAYVVPPGESDLVARILHQTYGPEYFRVYANREDAVDWLLA